MSTQVQTQQNPVRGIFWMFVTGLCFITVTALVKAMGNRIPSAEAAFIRYAFGLVFLIPLVGQIRGLNLTPRLWSLFSLRGFLHAMGVILWFSAMVRIPIAEVTALNYVSPIYVALGAALFLGEKIAARRILAILFGLIGALIILRPGFREIEAGHWAMICAAVAFSGSYLLAKVLADQVKASAVVMMLSIFVTIALIPFAVSNWVTPNATELAFLAAVALFATAGHYTMTLALAAAPVMVTQPITFLQLVWATILGVGVFHEPLDFWVILGGLVIICSASFITWREAVQKRRAQASD